MRRRRHQTWVLGGVLVLGGMLPACSSSGTATPGTATADASRRVPAITPHAAATLSSELASANPAVEHRAVAPELAEQLGATRLLPAGTSVHIDAASFRALSPDTATVHASTTGAEAGRWVFYLADHNGTWQLLDTEQVS